MGRWIFGGVLALLGLLYIGAGYVAVSGQQYYTSDSGDRWVALGLFLVVGVAAVVAAVSLLSETRH
ncbi:MAG TPA: hypothetical protein VKY74_24225 [Chloroflexia bacterium]|nr:hypothetical protein [Chloroflexia bacterium]